MNSKYMGPSEIPGVTNSTESKILEEAIKERIPCNGGRLLYEEVNFNGEVIQSLPTKVIFPVPSNILNQHCGLDNHDLYHINLYTIVMASKILNEPDYYKVMSFIIENLQSKSLVSLISILEEPLPWEVFSKLIDHSDSKFVIVSRTNKETVIYNENGFSKHIYFCLYDKNLVTVVTFDEDLDKM